MERPGNMGLDQVMGRGARLPHLKFPRNPAN
jgi:hypothetical protein